MTTTLHSALGKVGATPVALRDLLGSLLDAGDAYLVGSLAAGYGTGMSDIDVHIFDASVESHGAPMMFFLGRTIVDVVYFDPTEPSALSASLSKDLMRLPHGPCSLGATRSRKTLARLGRWATAIPLQGSPQPVLDQSMWEATIATSTRGAVADVVLLAAVAELAEAAGRATAPGAWRQAGRSVLEVASRASGEVFVGRKWTWTKAAAVGLDDALVEGADDVRTAGHLARVLDRVGLSALDPAGLVTLRRNQVDEIAIANRRLALVDGRRLVDARLACSGRLKDVVSSIGPADALAAIAYGVVWAQVDDNALTDWIGG